MLSHGLRLAGLASLLCTGYSGGNNINLILLAGVRYLSIPGHAMNST
jgi:hypothetical protein